MIGHGYVITSALAALALASPLSSYFELTWLLPRFSEYLPAKVTRISDGDALKALDYAERLASASWELGTAVEASLELLNPEPTVFGKTPFPASRIPTTEVEPVRALRFVKDHIWLNGSALQESFATAGDPPALGIPAVFIGQTQPEYRLAADRQLKFLVQNVPRWPNGAISHRLNYAELWADFIYMGPPFLAYIAVTNNDTRLMGETIQQVRLYRDVLAAGTMQASTIANGECAYTRLFVIRL
jgi:hypothetical protein